jgi:hypothetical protein
MTLRIERRRSGDTPIVQLIGEFDVDQWDAEHQCVGLHHSMDDARRAVRAQAPMITLPPLNR